MTPDRDLPRQLHAATVETCRFRRDVRGQGDDELAACDLVRGLLGGGDPAWWQVRRDACEACCRSFPPAEDRWNPVIAAMVYRACRQLAEPLPPGIDPSRADRLSREAIRQLPIQSAVRGHAGEPPAADAIRLVNLLPPPEERHSPAVRTWAVGVTTSPRRQPTLEVCLDSLVRAGWTRPHLFIDGAVRIPDAFADLPITFREQRLGAWPNFYLGLIELLMKSPHADAYLMVQDDALFDHRENLREYLERALWPGSTLALVSLFSTRADARTPAGWHVRRRGWIAGAQALIFSRKLAKAFVADRAVLEHRWSPDPQQGTRIAHLIHAWLLARGYDAWYPSPSLVQHIGDNSTLWPTARVAGGREAWPYAGDLGGGE